VTTLVDHPNKEEERARGDPVIQHLVNRALDTLRGEAEDSQNHESQMTDRGIRHQFLEVRLDHRDKRTVNDPDDRQR